MSVENEEALFATEGAVPVGEAETAVELRGTQSLFLNPVGQTVSGDSDHGPADHGLMALAQHGTERLAEVAL